MDSVIGRAFWIEGSTPSHCIGHEFIDYGYSRKYRKSGKWISVQIGDGQPSFLLYTSNISKLGGTLVNGIFGDNANNKGY